MNSEFYLAASHPYLTVLLLKERYVVCVRCVFFFSFQIVFNVNLLDKTLILLYLEQRCTDEFHDESEEMG